MFGALEFQLVSLRGIPQWQEVIAAISAELDITAACEAQRSACTPPKAALWRDEIARVRGMPRREQLLAINTFFNRIVTYRLDETAYNKPDYWATPLEFLTHAGDCEDYAIAKFVSLLELGYDNDDLRIVVVHDVLRNFAHAVLAVRQGDEFIFLDSLQDGLLSAEQVPQYVPEYSVNLTSGWAHIPRGELTPTLRRVSKI